MTNKVHIKIAQAIALQELGKAYSMSQIRKVVEMSQQMYGVGEF